MHDVIVCLKKNQSTPRPSEHPPVMGGKMSKRLGIMLLYIRPSLFTSLFLILFPMRIARVSLNVVLIFG